MPNWQLDAVAVVVLRPGDLDIAVTDSGVISIEAPTRAHWYLIPASVLHEHGVRRSSAAAKVPQGVADPYLIDTEHPLTSERLNSILAANVVAAQVVDSDGAHGISG